MVSVNRILEASAKVRHLDDRIRQAVRNRSRSPQDREEWERACAEFHQRFDSLAFPGGSDSLRRVRADEPRAVEAAVIFLLADPYHFRSGYLKEYLWHWLQHCTLSLSARARLERAALQYLDRRISREFWSMCKAMARLGRSEFWSAVADRSQAAAGKPEAFRAICLLTYGADIHAGASLRRSVWREWLMRKYGGG